ncbi:SufE family protein [Arachidicoccus ginsenosidivorans]|jgi:cysteine desulfuration protein SufE|uniref:SufE family protein n=1 Tax=Arachidicoccus ginsenosidivorans TaxID=496057 RepID=A0A5B8VHE2_9BACT|nr:SufE family protein [Arachidicoccus ginsenosidivorans]QEC70689.1 SufE family protein [Arachidicoccus ginsenosidivorans]
MKIDNIQDKIIEEFEQFSDRAHRFPYFRKLIQIGNELAPIAKAQLDKEHLVKGARSNIWIKASLMDNRVYFTAESDNAISKGLVGLLLRVFSGNTPRDIINTHLYFLNEINMYERLNQDWLDDLQAIIQKIKLLTAKLQVLEISRDHMADAV